MLWDAISTEEEPENAEVAIELLDLDMVSPGRREIDIGKADRKCSDTMLNDDHHAKYMGLAGVFIDSTSYIYIREVKDNYARA
jgi:hypothetical protein